jgi:DNA-binding CsgD family transcriptional regulator
MQKLPIDQYLLGNHCKRILKKLSDINRAAIMNLDLPPLVV